MGDLYKVNSKGSVLFSGERISLNREAVYSLEDIQHGLDIALEADMEELKTELAKMKDEEKELYSKLSKELNMWEPLAYHIMIYDNAIRYKERCNFVENLLKTTENKWVEQPTKMYCKRFSISNKTYSMDINVDYYNEEVTTKLWIGIGFNVDLVSESIRDNFDSKESIDAYIERRKENASSIYFNEMYPPIESKYLELFTMCGKLLKGYRLAEDIKK